MTIWEYARVIKNKDITPKEAEKSLIKLSNAINTYELQLDRLGLWKRVTSSAHRLRYRNEEQIKELLKEFDYINEELSTLSDKYLVPTHGDAHHGNHLYTDKGWLWTDFEDACIMPKYWDFVSYVSNRVLFNGSNEPIYQYIINNTMEINDIDFFHFMLRARMVFATLSNIDNVLLGYGDSGDEWFAKRQLELTIDYLDEQ
jgi:thiamine kinase-like enzyme